MSFTFTNMVGANVGIVFPEAEGEDIIITNEQGKSVLEIKKQGKTSHDPVLIDSLIKKLCAFFRAKFPDFINAANEKTQCDV